MAGWTHVGATPNGPGNTEDTFIRLMCPGGTQVGDLMVAAVGCETEAFGTVDITPPAGWTQLYENDMTVGANGPALAVFYKLATGDDQGGVTTYDFTWAHTATGRVGTIVTKRGVHRANPHVMTSLGLEFVNQTNISGHNIVVENATDLALLVVLGMDPASATWTPPNEYTERVDVAGSGVGTDDDLSLGVFDDDSALNGSHIAVASINLDTAIGVEMVFRQNPSPNAPNLPAIGNFDATVAQVWVAPFTDPMPGDVQTARQWRVFKVSDGSLAYDSGEVVSGSDQHPLPANTLVNGNQWQRQARVRDVDGNWSPWSALQSFHTSAPPTAVVTSPANDAEIVESSSHLVTWNFNDPEGEAQSAYRTVVTRTDVPGPHSDTGTVLSAGNSQLVTGLQDAGAYLIEQTVRDAKGIWSAVAQRSFVVDYAQPPQPVVAVTDQGHYLEVTITNPAPVGDEVVASYNDLFRRESGGAWIRIAAGLGVNAIYHDYATASGVAYEYRATAFTGAGGFLDSGAVGGQLALEQHWIHDPADPTATVVGFRARRRNRQSTRGRAVTMLEFEGRTHPVAEFGDALEVSVAFDLFVSIDDPDLLDDLEAFVDAGKTICYRDSRGRKVFGIVARLPRSDHMIGTESNIQLVATHYSEEV